jgi:hypothetical protein
MISRFIATHYSYEALIVAQAKLNPLAVTQDSLQQQIDALMPTRAHRGGDATARRSQGHTRPAQRSRERQPAGIEKRLRRVDRVIEGGARCRGLRSKHAA